MFGLFCREVVEVDELEPFGLVGVADQCPGSVGDEHLVMPGGGAHRGEVGDVVAATPAAGLEVVGGQPVVHVAVPGSGNDRPAGAPRG